MNFEPLPCQYSITSIPVMRLINVNLNSKERQEMKNTAKLLLGLLCALPLVASAVTHHRVAHTKIHGQDVVIFQFSPKMRTVPSSDKESMYKVLTRCANSAGLSGKAVMVWSNPNGRVGAYGPKKVIPHFETINMIWVDKRINKKLACD